MGSSEPMEGDGECTSRSHELLFVSDRTIGGCILSQALTVLFRLKFLQHGHGYGFGNNHI